MAKAKPAIVVIAILVLLQVSWATARHNHGGNHQRHYHKHAVMRVFHFGERGGGPLRLLGCDGKYHSDHELIVALPSKLFARGRRCHRRIRITSNDTGLTVEAQVVQECHSCKNNVLASSLAVWKKLGLHRYTHGGKVHVTWSDA